jgi:hypothetical protein
VVKSQTNTSPTLTLVITMDTEKNRERYNRVEVAVELCVRGDFDPNIISKRTGITPSKVACKGSKNASLGLPLYSGWTIASEENQCSLPHMDGMISSIVSKIAGKEEIFKSTLKELNAEAGLVILVRNYSFSGDLDFGLEISEKITKFLAGINASIEVSVCTVLDKC